MKKIFSLTFLMTLGLPLFAQTPVPSGTPASQGDSPAALFDKAQKLFDEKHYQEARISLSELVAQHPMESFVPRAELLLANLEEDFSAATARFQMLASEYEGSPEGAEAQKDLADRYYLADKYDEAAESYQDYIEQYPKSPNLPEIRYWLASAYLAQDQNDKAIEQFQKVLNDSKDSPWASKCRVGLGNAYFKKGRYDQAEQQYLKILQDDPAYDELNLVYFKLGQTFELEKKDHQAYAAYQTLLDRYPKALEVSAAQGRLTALAKVHPDYAAAAEGQEPSPTPALAAPTPVTPVSTAPVSSTPTPGSTPTQAAMNAQPAPTQAPSEAPAAKVEAVATETPALPFHVQIGVFTQKVYVTKAEKSLKKLGYETFVVSAKNDSSPYTYYKVRVGQYATRSEAEKTAKKLSSSLKQQVLVVEDESN
jgi:TolA-binding protein